MKNSISVNFLLFIGFLVIGYAISTKFYHFDYSDNSSSSSLIDTTDHILSDITENQFIANMESLLAGDRSLNYRFPVVEVSRLEK